MKKTILASVLICGLFVNSLARAELTGMDIGSIWPPDPNGSLTIDTPGSDYTVEAAGRDIWENADSFYYAYEPVLVTGDFEAVVRVDSLLWTHDPSNVHVWAKSGIMARENLTEDSAHAMVCRSGRNGIHLQARQVGGGGYSIGKYLESGDVFGSAIWVKLARKGNVFAAWWANDVLGATGPWQNPTITWANLPHSVFLGLATSSHNNTEPNNVVTAIYRNYSVGPLTDFPPIPDFGPFSGPEGEGGYIGIREVIDNGNISNQDDCNDSLTSGTGTIVDYTAPVLNIQDSGPNGHFGGDDVFGVVTATHRVYGDVNDISLVAEGAVEIPADGDYTFCLTTDDGFTLQFPGQDFTAIYGGGEIIPFANGSAITFWGNRPLADTFGIIHLPAGHHPFVLTYHEDAAGSAVEFSAAPGVRRYFDGDFLLVGSGEMVPAKPSVPNPPSINGGAGWTITMVYEPYTTGPSYNDELDSAIANVESAWAGTLPSPNTVVTATANWLNYEDPQASGGGAGGKGFPKKPFPGSDDGINNDHFAMGTGSQTLPNLLFAIRNSFDGTYTVNINTGIPTLIGPSAVTFNDLGLAHSGGSVLYGSTPDRMTVIETDGSGARVLGYQRMHAMAYDQSTGTLYAARFSDLYTVDTATGQRLTDLTDCGDWTMYGLAFVPSVGVQGALYGMEYGGVLFSYDIATETCSLVGENGLGTYDCGLTYAPDLDVLFCILITGELYKIDKGTAAATFVANTGVSGFSGLAYGPGPPRMSTKMTVYDQGYALTDEFDYWEDQSSHSYVATGVCFHGAYSCDGDASLRIGNGTQGTGSARIIASVTPGTDELKLRYKAPWVNSPSDNTLYVDGVDKGSIESNGCNWQELVITGISADTSDGLVEIRITDEFLGLAGDVQITYLEVYSRDPGLYTFLIHSDDSAQFRILDLAGGNPLDWDINDYEMTGGNEIVRLPDGTGFRFHGCCIDAKGTIYLAPGDYDIQVMFNERAGQSYFGLWSSLNGSRIFLLGDTTPVPDAPEIYALELVCPYMLFGDANHDCKVNWLDIAIAAMNWLTDCTLTPGDPACIHK